jgi:hypothetical protein
MSITTAQNSTHLRIEVLTLFKCRIVYTDKWNVRIILVVHDSSLAD